MRPPLWLTLDRQVCPAIPDGEEARMQLVQVEESDQPDMVWLSGWHHDGIGPGPEWATLLASREVLPAERR